MIGRFLNFLLTPIYTFSAIFTAEQFGIITEMYAYVAFLVVILTYGIETAFFRYSQKVSNKRTVYSTALISLLVTSSVFIFIIPPLLFSYFENNQYLKGLGFNSKFKRQNILIILMII